MAAAIYTGINRCLVPWAPFLGPGAWIEENIATGDNYNLPSAVDQRSSFKQRYDDIVGIMTDPSTGNSYTLSPGPDVSNDTFYNPTTENGPRKFSSLRGVDLAGYLDSPFGKIPQTGPISLKGDTL